MSSISHSSPVEELAAFLTRRPSAREIAGFQLSETALTRIQQLMDKNKDGALTAGEELHSLPTTRRRRSCDWRYMSGVVVGN